MALVPLEARRPGARPDPTGGAVDAARPFGLYVHFPFCGVHCPYCDFAVDARAAIPHDAYADAVLREMEARAPWFRTDASRPSWRSLYFGGGTPGLWRPDALGRVVAAAASLFGEGRADPTREITVEVNPGEVDERGLAALRGVGVNRLSIGAQSFHDAELQRLGRNHGAASIAEAVAAARAAGFDNLSLDLMFGVPTQTMASWQRSVDALIALEPEHVSAYALTVEKGTRFFNDDRAGRLPRPGDDNAAAMFEWGRARLAEAGYAHYEVSSYARSGKRAVHNQLYWTQASYLGVGASAASFRPTISGDGWRFSNPRATDTYLRAAEALGGPAPAKVEHRAAADLENEALWLALRTADGIDRAAHAARFGADPLAASGRNEAADRCVRAGWLHVDTHVVRLTPAGFLFADEVATRLWT